jgi:hypothetical protein
MAMKRNWRKLLIWLLVWLLSIPLVYFSFEARRYDNHRNRFSFYIFQKNAIGAKEQLDSLRNFYIRARKPGLGWLTNRTLFRKASLYEAAYAYLIGDYKSVEEILSQTHDPLGYRLRGAARFRLAQALWRAGNMNTPQIQLLLNQACEDFESALRQGLGDRNFSNDMWNFDICDPTTIGGALRQQSNQPVVVFDFPADDRDKKLTPVIPRNGPPGRLLPNGQPRPSQGGNSRWRP